MRRAIDSERDDFAAITSSGSKLFEGSTMLREKNSLGIKVWKVQVALLIAGITNNLLRQS